MPGLFQRYAEPTLMFRARPSFPTRLNLAPIRDITLHKTASIFIVNFAYVIVAELTDFAATAALTSSTAALATRPFRSSLHEHFS
jgi:hypothetical protein